MGTEIERKFLVKPEGDWRQSERQIHCHQGYIATTAPCSVRVRLLGERGYITMKTKRDGIQRDEFEYEIPPADARHMLKAYCNAGVILKTRHYVHHKGILWEVDVFGGENEGLILAEVELESPTQVIDLPDWTTKEVSDDPRYFNALLARFPYKSWSYCPPE